MARVTVKVDSGNVGKNGDSMEMSIVSAYRGRHKKLVSVGFRQLSSPCHKYKRGRGHVH